jgi:hypothetical protein
MQRSLFTRIFPVAVQAAAILIQLLPTMLHATAADKGRNCSEWLMEIQALHGRKRELATQMRE